MGNSTMLWLRKRIMDKIEKVIEVINNPDNSINSYDLRVKKQAKQICQLFEPKPNQSRLLADEEIDEIENEYPRKFGIGVTTAKAQDAKTASIKDAEWDERCAKEKAEYGESVALGIRILVEAECQARIEALIEEIEKSGQKEIGLYGEGDFLAIPVTKIQALKAKYCKEKG